MTEKKTAREIRARIERDVIAHEELPQKYGYTLNVSNKVLTVIYADWKRRYGIIGAPSDAQRIGWEREVKKILCKKFKETYKYALSAPVVGHQEEQLEELVRCLDIKAFEAELFEKMDERK